MVATYAEVLDGRTLWLAVEAAPGHLGLRRTDNEQAETLRGDLVEDDPTHRSTRVDLLEPTEDDVDYDLVLVPPGGKPARPLWIAPDQDRGPVVTPPSPTGQARFELTRTEEGTLRLLRRPVAPAHDLQGLTETPTSIELRVYAGPAGADSPAPQLLLLGDTGPVAAYPLTREGDLLHASLTVAALPDDAAGRTQVVVGTAEASLPVRRPRNDLAAADDAVLLPSLMAEDSDRPRLKLQWRRGGLLHAKLNRNEDPA